MDTKTTQMKINGAYLFRGCNSKGVRRTAKGDKGVGKSSSEKKGSRGEREDFRYALDFVDMGKLEVG